jgi:hypothetical protein
MAYLGATNDGSEGALGLRDGAIEVVKLLLDCKRTRPESSESFTGV